jgi:hypothetical protein
MLRRFRIRPEWTEDDIGKHFCEQVEQQVTEAKQSADYYEYLNDDDVKVGDKVIMVLGGDQPRRCLGCRGREANVLSIEKSYHPHPRMMGNIIVHVLNADCDRHNDCLVNREEIRRTIAWAARTQVGYLREELGSQAIPNNVVKEGWRVIGFRDYTSLRLPQVGDPVVVVPDITMDDNLERWQSCIGRCRSRLGSISHVDSYLEDTVLSSSIRGIHVRFSYQQEPDEDVPDCPLYEVRAPMECQFCANELLYRELNDEVDQEDSESFDDVEEYDEEILLGIYESLQTEIPNLQSISEQVAAGILSVDEGLDAVERLDRETGHH